MISIFVTSLIMFSNPTNYILYNFFIYNTLTIARYIIFSKHLNLKNTY